MFKVYSEQISYLSKTAVTSVRNRALNLSDRNDAELCVGISGEMFSHKDKPFCSKYHRLPLLLSTGAVTRHQLCLTFWTGSPCTPYCLDSWVFRYLLNHTSRGSRSPSHTAHWGLTPAQGSARPGQATGAENWEMHLSPWVRCSFERWVLTLLY